MLLLFVITLISIVGIALLLAVAIRLPLIDILLLFLCAILPLEWFVEVGGLILSIYDLAFVLAVPVFGYSLLRLGYYRNRYVFQLLALFTAYQMWLVIGQLAHPLGRSLPQLVWSSYKNYLVYLVFLLGGVVLAARPPRIQRWLLVALMIVFGFEAVIGLVQTASGGTLLNTSINNRYLGFFTPVPGKLQGLAADLTLLQGNDIDNGTFVGFIFRSVGTHRQSNYFAVSMIGGLAICMAALASTQRRLRRWAIGCGSLMLAALALSFTRTGYVALAAMCGWYIIARMQPRMRRRILVTLAVCSLVVALLVFSGKFESLIANLPGGAVVGRLRNLFQPENAPEFNFRTQLWKYALERVRSAPVFGLGQAIKLSEIMMVSPLFDRDLPLHNQVVGSIYFGGYLSGVLYVLLHLWLFWISRKFSRQVREVPVLATWVVAANLCFVGLAVESVAIDWMPLISLQGFFWLMAGVAAMQYQPLPAAQPVAMVQQIAPTAPPVPALVLEHSATNEIP